MRVPQRLSRWFMILGVVWLALSAWTFWSLRTGRVSNEAVPVVFLVVGIVLIWLGRKRA